MKSIKTCTNTWIQKFLVINKGENMGVAVYNTKFGQIKIEYDKEAVISIGRSNFNLLDIKKTDNEKNDLTDKVYWQLEEYFDGKREVFDFPFKLKGTDFQIKVWSALCEIPYGKTSTYKEIAEKIGSPKAFRAVGNANNKNKLMIVVPCHRVIGSDGKLVGYAGGLDFKKRLLDLESNIKA